MKSPDAGYIIISYLLAGMLFYGGVGWLVDRLVHTSFLLPVGVVFGMAVSVYMVIKRFGQEHSS